MKFPGQFLPLLVALLLCCVGGSVGLTQNEDLSVQNKIDLTPIRNVRFERNLLQTIENEVEVPEREDLKIESEERRTATGGIVNSIMIVLTVIAFIGNGLFLVYVFWLSK
eukprot:gene4191-4486_t